MPLTHYLTLGRVAALDRVSQPELNFPAGIPRMAGSFMHGGATVNGEPSKLLPAAPQADAERY